MFSEEEHLTGRNSLALLPPGAPSASADAQRVDKQLQYWTDKKVSVYSVERLQTTAATLRDIRAKEEKAAELTKRAEKRAEKEAALAQKRAKDAERAAQRAASNTPAKNEDPATARATRRKESTWVNETRPWLSHDFAAKSELARAKQRVKARHHSQQGDQVKLVPGLRRGDPIKPNKPNMHCAGDREPCFRF
eukprot:gene1889-2572_t